MSSFKLSRLKKTRPPGIKKQDYSQELFQRRRDIEDTAAAPTLSESDDDTDGSRKKEIPPQSWLHCPRMGQIIIDTFIPFKTPLDRRYDQNVPKKWRFTVDMLLESMLTYNKRLGLVVDLTNTTRYYNSKEVKDKGVRYVKMQCRGYEETPSGEQTKEFIQLCARFINENPLECIGVHSTSGFNRTGFLIIAYIIERQHWSVEAAVSVYVQTRPPGIYKQDYLQELFQRYGDIEDTPAAPALPDWCNE